MALETVEEHNKRRIAERQELARKAELTGVACPTCGEELRWYQGVYVVPAIYPPPTTRPAVCVKCGTIEIES